MPSLKRMSIGPKKKYEYFDGGRGIDMSESYEEETTKPLCCNPLLHSEPRPLHHYDRHNPPLFHHHQDLPNFSHHHQQQHSPPLHQHSPPPHHQHSPPPLHHHHHSPPPHHHHSPPLHHHSPPHHLHHHHIQPHHHLSDVMTENAYNNYSGGGECDSGRFQTPTISPVIITSSPMGYLPTSGSPQDSRSRSPLHYPRDYQPPTSIPSSPTGYGMDSGQEFPVPPGSYSPQGATVDLTLEGSSEIPQSPSPNSSRDDGGKKIKRKQRCRLCANHGIYAEVKGHKWYCPYRDPHQCEKCEITRKRQYYMAEQQKLTREQQQQPQPTTGVGVVAPVPRPQPEPTTITPSRIVRSIEDFPRREELVKETANLFTENLFQQINKIVRPPKAAIGHQYGRTKSHH